MFCTLNMWLDAKHCNGIDLLNVIPDRITVTSSGNYANGKQFVKGILRNLDIYIYDTGIKVKGSLWKFYCRNNLDTFNRQDVQKAIELLSDSLTLPIPKARVTKLHAAINVYLDFEPSVYYDRLGNCKSYTRWVFKNTLYYENKPENLQLVFYDKKKELSKDYRIDKNFENKNIFRYELRYNERINKQLKLPEITAEMLYSESFYNQITQKMLSEYNAIEKIEKIGFEYFANSEKITPKACYDFIITNAIAENPNLLKEILQHGKNSGKLVPVDKHRILNKGKLLVGLIDKVKPNDLILELDSKIETALKDTPTRGL